VVMSARFPRWSGLLVALALLAGVAGQVPLARPAGAYGTTITVTGHGWGHGRGMGQWGALGYALAGRSYSWILDHYYGNSKKSTRPESLMTVNLTEIENRHLIVTSGSNFRVDRGDGDVYLDVPAGKAVRVRRTSPGWAVDVADSCGGAGGWKLSKFLISPPGDATYNPSDTPRIGTAYTGDDVNRMLRVCGPSGNVRSYRGTLTAFSKSPNAGSWAVNTLPLELYLRGVVPRESPAYWGDAGNKRGMEALKAQAVAARSYAIAENRHPRWKAYDDVRSQVYGGAGLNGQTSESLNTTFASAWTGGEIRQMISNGSVARTEFGSSTGGYTAGGTFTAVRDDGDSVCASPSLCNPNHNWTRSVSVSAIQSAYPSIGTLTDIRITARNGLGADGGRVTKMTLTGTKGSTTISGVAFYWALGLKSDWFSIGAQYWLAEPNGRVRSYGGAPDYGSLEGKTLARPIVAAATTPSAKGFWLVASDGGIFSFGNARFYGSTGAIRLNQPIVGMAPTPSGNGYWLVASDGGVFTFGDARFFGSTGAIRLNQPISALTPARDGKGYWLVARDGGVFTFGSARFYGSAASSSPYHAQRLVASSTGAGYWVVRENGEMARFGDALGIPPPQALLYTP
jgi:SpoIID/LytB domain protein